MDLLSEPIRQKCEDVLGEKIQGIKSISGGDINEARVLKTKSGLFFIKFNSAPLTFEMLSTEAKGLQLLRSTKVIKIPSIIFVGKADSSAFLILEYIEPCPHSFQSSEKLGEQLAQLHQNSNDKFGLDHDNFIGTLAQRNHNHDTWNQFYLNERLNPQIVFAQNKNLLPSSTSTKFERLFQQLNNICPEEPAALIHGDLWKGNFIVTKNNTPVLIDPAVSYSHREMDLAMTKLFGGFEPCFYDAYNNSFPLAPQFEERVEIYQLYYLLVHLNLFGSSYLPSIQAILKKYI